MRIYFSMDTVYWHCIWGQNHNNTNTML